MRSLIVVLAVFLALAAVSAAPVKAQPVPTAGEVTKIDEQGARITIRHEPIKNLDMGRMNMIFRVKDPAMLKTVKVGDKIIFEADRVNGALTVVNLKKSE